jgi:hypothetical protein
VSECAKIKQTVRKLAFKPKTGSLTEEICFRSASDRSERAKIGAEFETAGETLEFSHGLQDFCNRDFVSKIEGF